MMATVIRCDVYPKEIEGVKRYRVRIEEIDDNGIVVDVVKDYTSDWCERAVDRACDLIDRAVAPPKKREKKSDDRA